MDIHRLSHILTFFDMPFMEDFWFWENDFTLSGPWVFFSLSASFYTSTLYIHPKYAWRRRIYLYGRSD